MAPTVTLRKLIAPLAILLEASLISALPTTNSTTSTITDAPSSTQDVVTVYETVTSCDPDDITTVTVTVTAVVSTTTFHPTTATPSSSWTTYYTSVSPTPSTSSDPDVVPYPAPSPRFIAADRANQDLLPCVPNTFVCTSTTSFMACAPPTADSPVYGSHGYAWGYERQTADGMVCLPFLSPTTSTTPVGDSGTQNRGQQGYYRDDRYTRARPDGSCPAGREGGIRCSSDGSEFFVCDQGGWVNMGPVASGTTCSGGAIVAS